MVGSTEEKKPVALLQCYSRGMRAVEGLCQSISQYLKAEFLEMKRETNVAVLKIMRVH